MTHLQRLHLARNGLGRAPEKVAAGVSHLTHLKHLDLSGNGLSSHTLAACMASMHELQTLDISWEMQKPPPATAFSAGLRALMDGATLAGVTRLCLRHSALHAVDCVILAAHVPAMPSLVFLDLSGNCIGTAGAGLLLRVLEGCAALQGVDMTGNNVDSNDPSIACMLPKFRGSWGVSHRALREL